MNNNIDIKQPCYGDTVPARQVYRYNDIVGMVFL